MAAQAVMEQVGANIILDHIDAIENALVECGLVSEEKFKEILTKSRIDSLEKNIKDLETYIAEAEKGNGPMKIYDIKLRRYIIEEYRRHIDEIKKVKVSKILE